MIHFISLNHIIDMDLESRLKNLQIIETVWRKSLKLKELESRDDLNWEYKALVSIRDGTAMPMRYIPFQYDDEEDLTSSDEDNYY